MIWLATKPGGCPCLSPMPPPTNGRSCATWRQSAAVSYGRFSRPENWSKARSTRSRHVAAIRAATALIRGAGIHPRTLYTLRDAGDIEQVGRGLYRLSTAPPLSNPDVVPIAIRIPRRHEWRVLRPVLQNDPRDVRYEISPALDQPYFLPNAIPEHASAPFGVFQPGI
jgi:hypothetical protein